jgi:glycosyltransferase involved in cell wall biosynthesis
VVQASIVMPTYNKAHYLKQTLASLKGQGPLGTFEVLVIDDGSSDDTAEAIDRADADYPLRGLHLPANRGRAAARNRGLLEARGDVVIFVDDDRVAGPDFVHQHLQAAGPKTIVLGKRSDMTPHRMFSCTPLKGDTPMAWRSIPWPLPADAPLAWLNFATGNLSAWREDLVALGGFDERFTGWGCEDTELGYRMGARGAGFIYRHQPLAENFHLQHPPSRSQRRD